MSQIKLKSLIPSRGGSARCRKDVHVKIEALSSTGNLGEIELGEKKKTKACLRSSEMLIQE